MKCEYVKMLSLSQASWGITRGGGIEIASNVNINLLTQQFEDSYYNSHATFAVMHVLILVLWEDTKNAHWRKPHLTVFAGNFPVRIHVCLQLHPSFACHFTILTSEHTVIMLWLNVHPQMFVRRSINAAYDTGRHGDCRFVLLTIVLDVKYYDFFSPKKNYRFWLKNPQKNC